MAEMAGPVDVLLALCVAAAVAVWGFLIAQGVVRHLRARAAIRSLPTTAEYREQCEQENERRLSELLAELDASPDTAVVRIKDCPLKTFYLLEPHATGDLAEEPEVRAAFVGGAREVVVVHG